MSGELSLSEWAASVSARGEPSLGGWPAPSQPSVEDVLASLEKRGVPAAVAVMAAWAGVPAESDTVALGRLPLSELPFALSGGVYGGIVCARCPGCSSPQCCSFDAERKRQREMERFAATDVHASGVRGRRWRDMFRRWRAGVVT